ncbi:MAG TPA: GSCFA domain-containing protein [Puia sp.]|nr:GSCFA domain-containing protein [Puia sp.]
MDFQLPIQIKSPPQLISYRDPILLMGSCFTEHIGDRLKAFKFTTLQNPHGILFDPLSVADSLVSYIHNKKYKENDLFYLNELWQSWHHHSVFSGIDKMEVLRTINQSQQDAHSFIQKARWLIITAGSSFSYQLTEIAPPARGEKREVAEAVANCHRAPAQWFHKHLLSIEEISTALDNSIQQLFRFNPDIQIIFTISPVRHIRDGVIENNRSKARLLEVVHNFVDKFDRLYYFPAYELVIDILRDYRFYDIDMVHPNFQATEFVMEKFEQYYIEPESQVIMREINKIRLGRKHKAFQPSTRAHKQFLQNHFELTQQLKIKYPFLNLEDELSYFGGAGPDQ